jgi:hypothetical protein
MMGSNLIDLTDKRFGRLVVLRREGIDGQGRAKWVCRCDCGKDTRPIAGKSLRQGMTKSCGCLRKQVSRVRAKRGTRFTGDYLDEDLNWGLDL